MVRPPGHLTARLPGPYSPATSGRAAVRTGSSWPARGRSPRPGGSIMDWQRFASRPASIVSLVTLGAAALAAGCIAPPGDPAEATGDPDATYSPYEADAIQPVENAPFAVPDFGRPRFHRRRFNVADFGAVGGGGTTTTAALR